MARGKSIFFNLWFSWKAQNQDALQRYGAVQMFRVFCWNHRHLCIVCGIDYAFKKYPEFFRNK